MNTALLSLAVCLFGGLGASCRYLADVTIKTYWKRAFPLSTFTINVVAGLLAGIVAALAASATATPDAAPVLGETWRLMLATGFLGGFSTFSTAINEMVTLAKKRRYVTSAGYLAASVVTPILAVGLGFLMV
ncbi:fluoride efflux transporter FluC [Bifidobacterium myosotis]|uniref:Fluoride-specific ion channel FluC n=1 Tax=Bifidobacterium myosotis TaxID=1630166 RepID=A0A5M9ZPR9_9BIFI|nr:CrcB family protein [Bifidobacterium myosotis]KAA8829485.1 CrcB family protein [Bifidobacterium myosotis]